MAFEEKTANQTFYGSNSYRCDFELNKELLDDRPNELVKPLLTLDGVYEPSEGTVTLMVTNGSHPIRFWDLDVSKYPSL